MLTKTPGRVENPTRQTLWNRLQKGVEVLEDSGARERSLKEGEVQTQLVVLDFLIEDARLLRRTLRYVAKRDEEAHRKREEFRRIEAEALASEEKANFSSEASPTVTGEGAAR